MKLGIDPAKITGYACESGEHGVWHLKVTERDHNGMLINRLEEHLFVANEDEELSLIAYEEAGFASNNRETLQFHHQIRGMVLSVAAKLGIDAWGYNPMTLKKFATGDGRAEKEQMIHAASRILKVRVIDDNDADACFLLEMAKQQIQPQYINGRSTKAKKRRQSRRKRAAQPKLFT